MPLTPAPGDPFVTGVNYWPRKKAMYWWKAFDADEVRSEFELIASLEMDVVRIFLLWDDWQPDPSSVAADSLSNLGTVLDVASEMELGVDLTFFTGHMSGPNWAPRWMLDPETSMPSPHVRQVMSGGEIVNTPYRNMFEDRQTIEAERLLIETVVGAYAGHPGIWMWNLGNEPDLFAFPATAASGASWSRDMVSLVRSIDPQHPVTVGLHAGNLFEDNGLRVDQVFDSADLAVMHGYPMYIPWARSELDPDFVPFLCSLTSALSGKPCLAEEWGGCTAPAGGDSTVWAWNSFGSSRTQFMAGETDLASYVESTLPRLVDTGATGAMLWCFADYHESLWDRPPCDPAGAKHERHFGLVRPDGSLKPHAEVIRDFKSRRPRIKAPDRKVTLDIDADDYYDNPALHARRLYESF